MVLYQLNMFNCTSVSSIPYLVHKHKVPVQRSILCLSRASSNTRGVASDEKIVRRSANYKPGPWNYDFLTTLNNGYQGDTYLRLAEILKQKVAKQLIIKAKGPALMLLELVDEIERLGVGRFFEEDIKIALSSIQNVKLDHNLHATSLYFRIMRQHGYPVSQDVFKIFTGPHGNFTRNVSMNIEGLLSLYEASFLSRVGEAILDDAKFFAHGHLKECRGCVNINKLDLVKHALEVPLYLNAIRLEARWYIDAYSRREDANPDLLELARLDYNMVQAIHQNDIIDLLRWWKNLGLIEHLPFSRDRLVECFFAAMSVTFEPQYSNSRKGLTKLISFINMVDDIYDVYATLDEAEHFTDVVARWDVNSLDKLPDYMKICFVALHNSTNEIAYYTLKDNGLNVIPYLKKMWRDQCKAYLVEAKWFHTGYKPTLDEYLDNGWISITGPLLLLHIYLLMSPKITIEAVHYLVSCPELVRSLSRMLRLIDDMGTYENESLRGDVLKSVQCYMHDMDVTEEVAREYISHLIDETWIQMNSQLWTNSPLPEVFIKEVVNLARAVKTTYQYGDPCSQAEIKHKIQSLLVDPVPIWY
ncbi:hypothetical protein ACHQM5_016705 [Ranunculus cassubicifolius]